MKFEDLQAIWDTQNERPLFSMNDGRLAIGLYQQRQRSRRRLFWVQFAPMYVAALFLGVMSAGLFLAFFLKTITKMRITDPLMNVWDGAALVAAIVMAVVIVVRMYVERRKHERTQNAFAPSLREELERGIAQLDFEMGLHSVPRVRRVMLLIAFGTTVVLVESARLNGQPMPWWMLAFVSSLAVPGLWYGNAKEKKLLDGLMQRRRALESMLASLHENTAPE